ncbi:hypothetical protein [Parapedobacter indicus]|uniref:Uncharacterized protein n=1 Tax=Parapedobacter indicus TaxID=1477437 RepID=A0A1I3V385_9SPHI|nr:hypothetical protein [Parapedobacter indicus]PPK99007.1 hypothetical protein CLV26_11537 [Parapedobacter indicus]SFJ88816.1 hypothetical protein SAMN05444682_115140 [Parapedobacter indicus]
MATVKIIIDDEEFEIEESELPENYQSCTPGQTWCWNGQLLKCNGSGQWFNTRQKC